MEGDRILRCILNQTPNPSIVKDIENYLSPVQRHCPNQIDLAALKKYQSFALKFLRCSIQRFETEKSKVCFLLEACKHAITSLDIVCNLMITAKDFEACQLDRLIKLLYHFLTYLSKNDDFDLFKWYSEKALKFCKSEGILIVTNGSAASKEEMVKINEKIFEMHWKLASQNSKNKPTILEVLCLRLQGLHFLLISSKDLMKFGKYFENTLLTFLQENRNQNVAIDGEVSNLITNVIQYVGNDFIVNSNEGTNSKATVTYMLMLSFKTLILHNTSKDCLEKLAISISSNEKKSVISTLSLPLIEAYKTNMTLRKLSGCKLKKEFCKQAKNMNQHLQSIETVHEELLKSKLLIMNPKIAIIYDIIKILMTYQEKLCWDILIHLSELAANLKKHVELLLNWLSRESNNGTSGTNGKTLEAKQNALKIISTQWYAFVCWCLQTFQTWLNSKEKTVGDAKCSCVTKPTLKRENLFENCLAMVESATLTLNTMEDNGIDMKTSENHWIGVTSYNLGILAQNDASLNTVAAFLDFSVTNIKSWVRKGGNDVLKRLQQSNLVMKQKVLVDISLKAGLKDKALSSISEFVVFLFATNIFNICIETAKDIVRDQVACWMKAKEKISRDGGHLTEVSILSKEIDMVSNSCLTSSSLKLIIESEIAELISRRSPSCVHDAKELLAFVSKKYQGNDNEFIAWVILEYLSLPEIGLKERLRLCQKAKALLEDVIISGNHQSSNEDLLAMSCFYLGCCDQKIKFLERRKMEKQMQNESENEMNSETEAEVTDTFDYIPAFDIAVNKWSHLVQAIFNEKSKDLIEGTFKSIGKSAGCLSYIGSIYALHRQQTKSIHAFHLSNLLMTLLDPSDSKDRLRMVVCCESSRQLADLFDLPSSIGILDDAPIGSEVDGHTSIRLQIAKATILTKAGEFQYAADILDAALSDDWLTQKTQRSFFLRADSLFLLALCYESSSSKQTYHPLVLVQEALKIFRNLVSMLFTPNDSTAKSNSQETQCWTDSQDSNELSSWIVLGRLLDCLLYIVQRYRFQGCIPEARCHIKEALLLCEQFSLHERKIEFLIEEAEASLISHEAEKSDQCLNDISDHMRTNLEGDEIQAFNDHEDDCTCKPCSDIFFLNICLNCIIIRRRHAFLSSMEASDQMLNGLSVAEALSKVHLKTIMAMEDLKSRLNVGRKTKRKKVSFHHDSSIESELKAIIKAKLIFSMKAVDVAELLLYGHRLECYCLDFSTATNSQKATVLPEADKVLGDIKNLRIFPLISTSYRTSFARLIQCRVELFLSTVQGSETINFAWYLHGKQTSVESNGLDCQLTGGNVVVTKTKSGSTPEGHKNLVTTRGRKQRSAKRTAQSKKKLEKSKFAVEKSVENKEQCLMQEKIDHVKAQCNEALSYLVSNVHCMQIKMIYQLMSVITGNTDPVQSALVEALSFSRTLSQQLLIRTIKNLRKSTKTEEKVDESKSEATVSMLEDANQTFSFHEEARIQQQLVTGLPENWRVCSIRLSHLGTKSLIVTRFQANKEPIILRIPIDDQDDNEKMDLSVGSLVRDLASAFVTDPLEEFDEILDQSLHSLETEDVKTWWNNRKKLDKRLQKVLHKIDHNWLGGWKGILLGEIEDVRLKSKVKAAAEEFCCNINAAHCVKLSRGLIEVLFESYSLLDRKQVDKALKSAFGSNLEDAVVELFIEMADQLTESWAKLDTESTPAKGRRGRRKEVQAEETKRSPIILILDKHLQKIPWESISLLRNQAVSRMPSLLLTRLAVLNSEEFLRTGVNTEKAFYVLNPRNDLQNTQKTFEDWFQSVQGWSGVSGRAPTETEYRSALEEYEMFIYCGHGNGREFLRGDDIQRINCKAVTFLIGCSSGKLQVKGELDARGMALHYLMAGCPAIIANLWDVTDKDIDRFLSKLLQDWLEKKNLNLTDCIPIARDACLLRYLIGSSPILYGLPVVLKNTND